MNQRPTKELAQSIEKALEESSILSCVASAISHKNNYPGRFKDREKIVKYEHHWAPDSIWYQGLEYEINITTIGCFLTKHLDKLGYCVQIIEDILYISWDH